MNTRCTATLLLMCLAFPPLQFAQTLTLSDSGYFETRGANILVFSNWYNDLFSDSKMSGIEIIHHGVRTVTNGDVRLSPTPGQWDPIPEFVERKVDSANRIIEAFLRYPAYDFKYSVKVEARPNGIAIMVVLREPLPQLLEGRAGFNLEFLPTAYFGRSYILDEGSGYFPLHPVGPMKRSAGGQVTPGPIAAGSSLVLAPEDPARRISIRSESGPLMLFDGRNQAQNGWFVVRSLLPAERTGTVLEWVLTAGTIPGWTRTPMIAFSQAGYHPNQKKVAVIELDDNDHPLPFARLLKIDETGREHEVFRSEPKSWGQYLRYRYATFDFTSVIERGLYIIEYGTTRTPVVRIAPDVYDNAWHATLDVFLPVQMDHMRVTEAYRVWHGAPHLDDALQAPVNHEHFDLYAQGPTTDTPYKPGEHIPGLNVGGWFDAGDFDIRTQTQYATVLSLVQTWEAFQPLRDETTIDQKTRSVDIHTPDGTPDLLQQIAHGALQLVAQHKAVGHAIPGIIDAHLHQYTHLGDAASQTDNRIYNPTLDSLAIDGFTSGAFDDRWAFTSKSSALNYGSAAALAAASRALRGANHSLAGECLAIARRIWKEEHTHAPDMFRFGNTTGGRLEVEELTAAVELLISTQEDQYAQRIEALWPHIERGFGWTAAVAVRALPFMDSVYTNKLRALARRFREFTDTLPAQNPFGVPITRGGWGGNGFVVGLANTNYLLHKAFPDIIGPDVTLRGLNYLYGCHPGSAVSFVSGVGAMSKRVAYGNNRADFSFIAGGVVPGILVVKPDYPENMEDWPFMWGENEYVVNLGASYIFLVQAAIDLLQEQAPHK